MKELKFVDVGEGITEGHFQKWLAKDGENVKEDQAIAQIETDKAVVSLPAPISGILKQVAKDDSTLKIGDTIAYVGTADELKNTGSPLKPYTPNSPQPAAQPQAAAPQPTTQSTAVQQPAPQPKTMPIQVTAAPVEVMATPYVRKLARDMNIDITKVTGTGPSGRVLENDVRNFVNVTISKAPIVQQPAATASSAQLPVVQPVEQGATKPSTPQPAAAPQQPQPVVQIVVQKQVPKFSELLEEKHEGQIERVPLSQTRKAIARNVEISLTIPSFTHIDLINATSLYNIVKMEKPNAEKLGVKLTFLPYIIKAVIEGLRVIPNLNSSFDADKQEIIVKKYYNIGLAAEAPDGLKVVVIKDADKKSIIDIAKEIQRLHEKINNQTITIDEMKDSTFTITNVGSLGGGYISVPIINGHEAGILGVSLIRDTPAVENGQVKIQKQMTFSLVIDHRIVDGAEAVKFGNILIKALEDPDFLGLNLR